MIYFDDYGYPVDQTGDGGDSAVRASILVLCKAKYDVKILNYNQAAFGMPGHFVRHPMQIPWNNPRNFSRDQTMMIIAAFHSLGQYEALRHFFRESWKRLFFCQNFDRDHVGTNKYPFPHVVDGKWRLFDFADIMLPNHIGSVILAGKIKSAYWFLPVSYLFHLLFLILHALGNHHEENQAIAECYLHNTLWLYKKIKPSWKETSVAYWGKRKELEYHIMLEEFVK